MKCNALNFTAGAEAQYQYSFPFPFMISIAPVTLSFLRSKFPGPFSGQPTLITSTSSVYKTQLPKTADRKKYRVSRKSNIKH
ncbi:MAG: hypothetical protein JZU47_06565 [Prolixibacteraceae bacterium]|nr:hypothetical protein [Prolixibacteraceae bacterium]